MQENENMNNQYGVPHPAGQTPNGNNGTYTPPLVRDAVPKNNSSMAVASLVLGIFGLLGCWVPVWNLVLSIAGLVCGIICLAKDHKSKGMGTAGIVISTLALLFSIVVYMLLIIAVA
ncbi:MAG: DUF4190 domain-containing protein [Lachnospiraceae bacterium]